MPTPASSSPGASPVSLDETDRQILALLRANARRPLREIAEAVGLTVAPVQRRIARLERLGVIGRYTVQVNYGRLAAGVEAVAELRFEGNLEPAQILEVVRKVPEAEEVLTLAGDPDALVRIRVDSVEHLGRVISRLRAAGPVAGTRTMLVLDHWNRFE